MILETGAHIPFKLNSITMPKDKFNIDKLQMPVTTNRQVKSNLEVKVNIWFWEKIISIHMFRTKQNNLLPYHKLTWSVTIIHTNEKVHLKNPTVKYD